MRAAYRVRLVANLVNGSTLAGLVVAAAGRARLGPGRDGLLIGERYRLPVPPAPAFTLGNVIMTRVERDALLGHEALLAHEARHATQFAWCAGLVMLPLYFTAAGVSWVLTGDFGSRNIFERRAGLADGGYTDRPLRPALARWVATARAGRRSQARGHEVPPAQGAAPPASPAPWLHAGPEPGRRRRVGKHGAVWAVVTAPVPARGGAVGGLRAAAAGAVRRGHLPGGRHPLAAHLAGADCAALAPGHPGPAGDCPLQPGGLGHLQHR